MRTLYIEHVVQIKAHQVFRDGELLYSHADKQASMSDFIKAVYKHFAFAYPKFYKMDDLSKLSFVGAELLMQQPTTSYEAADKAIVLMNKSSSLATDKHHQASIDSSDAYFPSPAVFVYTLPNIAIGEICIRHAIKGENYFLVQDAFNTDFLVPYVNLLFEQNQAAWCLCGWTEFDGADYELFFYSVTDKQENALSLIDKKTIFVSLKFEENVAKHSEALVMQLYKL